MKKIVLGSILFSILLCDVCNGAAYFAGLASPGMQIILLGAVALIGYLCFCGFLEFLDRKGKITLKIQFFLLLALLAGFLYQIYKGELGIGHGIHVKYEDSPILFGFFSILLLGLCITWLIKGGIELLASRGEKKRGYNKDLMTGLVDKDEKGELAKEPAEPAQIPQQSLTADDFFNTEPKQEEFIRFACDCSEKIKVASKHAGRMGKCPKCQKRIKIPESS